MVAKRYVVLRRGDGSYWEHVGAQTVEIDENGLGRSASGEPVAPEFAAIEAHGGAGVFVAVPFADWVLFEAEAQVTVRQVPTVAGLESDAPAPVSETPTLASDPLEGDDMEGMVQGPKSR